MNSAFYNRFIGVAGILGAIGVIVGAFGAHFLKERIDITHIATLNTGVLYLFIHSRVSWESHYLEKEIRIQDY